MTRGARQVSVDDRDQVARRRRDGALRGAAHDDLVVLGVLADEHEGQRTGEDGAGNRQDPCAPVDAPLGRPR